MDYTTSHLLMSGRDSVAEWLKARRCSGPPDRDTPPGQDRDGYQPAKPHKAGVPTRSESGLRRELKQSLT